MQQDNIVYEWVWAEQPSEDYPGITRRVCVDSKPVQWRPFVVRHKTMRGLGNSGFRDVIKKTWGSVRKMKVGVV